MNVLNTFRLDNRVALVTGGAGLYGRQIVAALAEAGARVVMASRNVAPLRELANTMAALGQVVHALEFDQEQVDSVQLLCDQVERDLGPIDILVNNAVLRSMNDWDGPLDDFAKSMAVN